MGRIGGYYFKHVTCFSFFLFAGVFNAYSALFLIYHFMPVIYAGSNQAIRTRQQTACFVAVYRSTLFLRGYNGFGYKHRDGIKYKSVKRIGWPIW